MGFQRLTDRTIATGVSLNDLIHIVITGDTSQNPAGSSYKATIAQVGAAITTVSVPGLNNEVLTSDGSGGIVAESNMTFDGLQLSVTGTVVSYGFALPNIDTSTGELTTATPMATSKSVDWLSRITYNANNIPTIDWENRFLYNSYPLATVDWEKNMLYSFDGVSATTLSVDWQTFGLYDKYQIISSDWSSRVLFTNGGNTGLKWFDDTILFSAVYQQDYKSVVTQDAVSNNYNTISSYLGDIIEADGITTFIDSAVTDGNLVYLDTNATWYPVNQAASGATFLLGIAHNVYAPGGTGYILLEGHVVIDDTSFSGPSVQSAGYGLPIYIEDSTTTGTMSTVVPTTTGSNIVRILGHCYQQNGGASTQWMMKFRPSNDWIEI